MEDSDPPISFPNFAPSPSARLPDSERLIGVPIPVGSETVGNVPFDLDLYKVPGLPLFYIRDFVTREEEQYLMRKVESAPKGKWRTLNGRRLQVWGGELTRSNALLSQPLPPWLTDHPDLMSRIGRTDIFAKTKQRQPNHVIVNEYLPGQGIFAHKDGPAYYPAVATLSLGGHGMMQYHAPLSSVPAYSLFLEPRSLVITTGELYEEYSHSIEAVDEDDLGKADITNLSLLGDEWSRRVKRGETVPREKRISLTCRVVEKEAKGLLGMRGPR
ncbi:hypothetical protein DACRYDRAFT_119640 [Dacryopinax primogenitus]|uniref:Alpha-ketoglutarate-dependent dioxygenase AlkB-like domain-containing protein n=1 Tax=Dacryopinax primogenitus (strain DJM 731) TaxID=1858805 RepID=M5G064_DACPD|nr:uncharacterized protein DACRYDRAFT_119640 [Dacryopinax primogenitus]EJT97172.1 hypothetical protein DACRYDRAFT_119640 [Dacryopinax primogenitus]